jgi:hypothetical protein
VQTFGTIWGTMVASQPTVLGSVMLKFRPFPAFLALAVAAVVAPVIGLQGAGAQEAPALAEVGTVVTTTTLTGPARYADTGSPLDVAVTPADATVVPDGSPVVVERRVGGTWRVIDTPGTVAGHATTPATLSRDASDNVFRATYAGDATYAPSSSDPVRVPLKVRGSKIGLGGPDEVVDEKSVTLRVYWRTASGIPVPGKVNLYRRSGKKWVKHTSGTTGDDGRTTFRLTPRTDSRWQVRGLAKDWVASATSPSHAVDNLPPGVPVRLPTGAPSPRVKVPKQPRGVGGGPNAVISTVPTRVWNQMTGITWHRGCPVGRSGLRYLKINYWDYQGYRRRGEMVVASGAVGQVSRALADMYRAKLPIRSMYRVDRFGYSSRVRGGNDHKSMAAGNTSGFNCRDVVNRPGVRSPHSYGRAIDINTWENPYRSQTGLVPNSWWMSRSHPRVAWRSSRHAVVRIMRSNNIRWTYGNGDTQHFDAATSNGRVVMAPGCTLPAAVACD